MKKRKLCAVVLSSALVLSSPLQAIGQTRYDENLDGQLSVSAVLTEEIQSINSYMEGKDYASGQAFFTADSEEYAAEIAKSYNAELESFEAGIGVISFNSTVEEKMEEALDAGIAKEAIYPDYLLELTDTMVDPDFDEQWQHNKINDIQAWDISRGDGVKVAVIDNGFMVDHEDLADNVKGTYNATDGSSDVTQLEYDKDAEYQHGTHVAGIIAAVSGNGFGGCGVAPNVDLYLVKCSDSNGDLKISALIRALNWAAENKIDVVNISLGASNVDENVLSQLQSAIDGVYDVGGVIAAAAGNAGVYDENYPAALNHVIAVGAIGEISNGEVDTTKLASYSNFGNWVDIAAPGTGILSTVPLYENKDSSKVISDYNKLNGTSMATPVVAGVAALVYGANKSLIDMDDSSVADAITYDLKSSTDKVTYSNSKSGGSVVGCIDAEEAVSNEVKPVEKEDSVQIKEIVGVTGQKIYFNTVSNANASGKAVKYTTSDKKIAVVNKKGLITFKKNSGQATISMVDKISGEVYGSVVFKVEKPEIIEKKVLGTKGVSFNAANYVKGTSAEVCWFSSKPSVASVDMETGTVIVNSKGKARIYAVYGASNLSDKLGTRKKYKFTIKASDN